MPRAQRRIIKVVSARPNEAMSKKRVFRQDTYAFPYGKSVVGSCGLIVAVMLALGAMSDPVSGVIRTPALAWLALIVLPAAIAGAFYGESRLRRRRKTLEPRRPNRMGCVQSQ